MTKIVPTLLLTLLITACSAQENNETNTTESTKSVTKQISSVEAPLDNNRTAPTTETQGETSLFTLQTLDGKTLHIDEQEDGLSFKEYKDKVVLLLFFGHKCPPCLAEIPVLKALTEKAHKDLEIIAIEVQGQSEEQLKAFKKRKGINYTLVASQENFDFIDYIAKKANWSGAIPFLLGVNKKGTVKVIHAGGLGTKQFDDIYTELSETE